MTKNDKIWHCPACPQTSRRKWNLEVHIKRKHQGLNAEVYRGQQYQNGISNTDTVLTASTLISHPIIQRIIRQYEVKIDELTKRCEKLESAREDEVIDNYLRVISDLTQKRGRNEADYLNTQLMSLITAGIIVPVLILDANGNFAIKYEPRNPANTAGNMYTYRNGPGSLDDTRILEILVQALRSNQETFVKVIKAMERDADIEHLPWSANLNGPPPRTTNSGSNRFKQDEPRLDNDQAIVTHRGEAENSNYRQEQERILRRSFIDTVRNQDQIDKIPMSISGMVTSNGLLLFGERLWSQCLTFQMPRDILNELRKLMLHPEHPKHTQSQPVISGKSSPNHKPLNSTYQDFSRNKQRGFPPELMLEDQKFIEQIERMQKNHMMEQLRAKKP